MAVSKRESSEKQVQRDKEKADPSAFNRTFPDDKNVLYLCCPIG